MLNQYATGLYAPAISLINAQFLPLSAVSGVMLPVLSHHYTNDVLKAEALSKQLLKWSAMLAVVLGSGLALIARPLVHLVYGVEYALSGNVLAILGGVLAFRTVSFALGAILAAVGLQSKRVIVQAISAAVNVVLNLLSR